MRKGVASLFVDDDDARVVLDVDGPFGIRVADHLLELWERFRPFADRVFVNEIRDAVQRMKVHGAPGKDRTNACRDFQQRYWEMWTGCSFLDRGVELVPSANRDNRGPDLLAKRGGQRVWIECIAPEPGIGPDAVADYPDEDGISDIPDDQVKLRFLGALKKKREAFERYEREGIVEANDARIVPVNGGSIPYARTDFDPPRIVRVLYGIGTFAWKFDRATGAWSPPYLTQSRSIATHSGSPVSTVGFVTEELSKISAVIYSAVNAWNRSSPDEIDLLLIHNPRSSVPLAAGWLPRVAEYSVTASGFLSKDYRDT